MLIKVEKMFACWSIRSGSDLKRFEVRQLIDVSTRVIVCDCCRGPIKIPNDKSQRIAPTVMAVVIVDLIEQ